VKLKTLGDIMHSPVHTIAPDMLLSDTLNFLESRRISGVPVVDDEIVIGVLSRSDLASHLARGGQMNVLVETVMTPFAFLLRPNDPIVKGLEVMLDVRIHRLVITDEERRPIGIVTTMDLLAEMLKQFR
jgi:predicted transcriptional regulator